MIRFLLCAFTVLIGLAHTADASRMPPDSARALAWGRNATIEKPRAGEYLRTHPRVATLGPWGWRGGPAPAYVRNPVYHMEIGDYRCDRLIYITPTGTSSGPGTSSSNGFDTFDHLQSNVSPALGANGGGDCVGYLAGHTYTDSVQFHAASGGSSNTPSGWVAIESVGASGEIVDAAVHTHLSGGAAVLINPLDNGTPGIGTDSTTTAPSFIIIRGLELVGPPMGSSFETAVNTNGDNHWSNPGQWGPHHWVVFNTYVHDYPGGGLAFTNGDFIWLHDNVIITNSCCNQFSGSAMSVAAPGYDPTLSVVGYDAAMPYRIIASGNYCYNSNEFAVSRNNPNLHTDGECGIFDDFADAQAHGAGAGQLNRGLYKHHAIMVNNVAYNNGGNCVQFNSVWFGVAANNTCYRNNVDLANTGTGKQEILIGSGDWNQTWNNVAQSSGPWNYITASLVSDNPVININDVTVVSAAVENLGNFNFRTYNVSPSDPLPSFINGHPYNVIGYSVDITNTCNKTDNPGCRSGTITLDTPVLVADGQQFKSFQPQTVTNGIGDCTGPERIGVRCSWQGFAFPIQSVPFRSTTITTCSGENPGCPIINLVANNANSVIGSNLSLNGNGGGNFWGLNSSTPLSATVFGDESTVLGTNVTTNPAFEDPGFDTDDAAAPSDTNGPGWLAPNVGTSQPPSFALLASVSPAVHAATIVPAIAGGEAGPLPPFCPEIDILGNPRDCRDGHFNMGAYDTQGERLAYVGLGDVTQSRPALLYWGSTPYAALEATGRQLAYQYNCNSDPTTAYLVAYTTSARVDDNSIEGNCTGFKTGSNIVHLQRAIENVFGDHDCDLIQTDPSLQPDLLYNNVNNISVVDFGTNKNLYLDIDNSNQFCGVMFAQASFLAVFAPTFGSGLGAVMDANQGEELLGFQNATNGQWSSGSTTLTPSGIDHSHYFFLAGTGNAPPGMSSRTGFMNINLTPTTGTFGGTVWQGRFTWGASQGGAKFTASVASGTGIMTVATVSTGIGVSVVKSGQTVTGAGFPGGVTISNQIDGTFGGAGHYQLSDTSFSTALESVTSSFLGNGATGFGGFAAVYGIPFNLTNLQVLPVALSEDEITALYTFSVAPNYLLP